MSEKIEPPKECDKCQRNFISEDEEATSCALCREEERKNSVNEIFDTPEVREYMDRLSRDREKFMKKMLRKHLKIKDRPLFWAYKKLADYFAGGDKVHVLQKMESIEDAQVGIRIYGVEYWMDDSERKPISGYE